MNKHWTKLKINGKIMIFFTGDDLSTERTETIVKIVGSNKVSVDKITEIYFNNPKHNYFNRFSSVYYPKR